MNQATNTEDSYYQGDRDYASRNFNNAPVSYQTFYDELSPFGDWVNYPGYGYVWVPANSYGFRPYETNGFWVSTVSGWAWASNYSWGWAPFHYGRWFRDPALGWAWVPGYQWAPAWVQWGRYNNYYGWAPLSPGASFGSYMAPYDYWSFAPCNSINSRNLNRYIYRPGNTNIVNNVTIINNYNTENNVTYQRGPDYNEVSQATKTTIRPVPVASTTKPGKAKTGSEFKVFKPSVVAEPTVKSSVPAPPAVRSVDEMRVLKQQAETRERTESLNSDRIGSSGLNTNDDFLRKQDMMRRKQADRYEEMDRMRRNTPAAIDNAPVNPRGKFTVPSERTQTRQMSDDRFMNQNNGGFPQKRAMERTESPVHMSKPYTPNSNFERAQTLPATRPSSPATPAMRAGKYRGAMEQ